VPRKTFTPPPAAAKSENISLTTRGKLKLQEFKKELRKLNLPIAIYVFSLEGDDFKEEFEDMNGLVKLKPIPAVILNVYKRIFK